MHERRRLSLALIYPFLDWFIPDHLKQDGEVQQRARMFLLSHLFGPFLGHTITVYLYCADPSPGMELWVLAGSISVFWCFPILLRLTKAFVFLALLSVQNLTFATLWGSYNYGGVSSPFLPWLLTVPLLAFFYLGADRKLRLLVLSLITLNLAAFYALYATIGSFPTRIPVSELERVGIISTVSAAVYVSIMALYYANIVASQSELEREVRSHRETATKLMEAAEAADRASQAKSEFLARMSHELRTPLNSVIGYSEVLLEEAQLADRRRQIADLQKIYSAGKDLLTLITELLDLAKVEAGRMELFNEPFQIAELIGEAAEKARAGIEKNGNQLTVSVPSDMGGMNADATRIGEVVQHLLSNAGKFTKGGSVSLSASRELRNGAEWICIVVSDTGVGIQPEHLPLLFQSFGEIQKATSSKYGGRGLGLALSRKLCRLMGGDVTVASAPGLGSTFSIHLPLTPAESGTTDPSATNEANLASPEPDAKGTVLVIDDDLAVLDLTHRLLAKEGFRVVLATEPLESIQLARKTRPTAIVLDVVMGAASGWDVLRDIKSDPSLAAIPVVMLTVIDDRKTASELGAADYLMKPVDRDLLVRSIRRLHALANTRSQGSAAGESISSKRGEEHEAA